MRDGKPKIHTGSYGKINVKAKNKIELKVSGIFYKYSYS